MLLSKEDIRKIVMEELSQHTRPSIMHKDRLADRIVDRLDRLQQDRLDVARREQEQGLRLH